MAKILSSKGLIFPVKIKELEFSHIMHICTLCPQWKQFRKIPYSGWRGVVITNCSLLYLKYGQNSRFKRAKIPPQNNWNQNFLVIHDVCTFMYYWQTDWLTIQKTLFPSQLCCMGYNNIQLIKTCMYCIDKVHLMKSIQMINY